MDASASTGMTPMLSSINVAADAARPPSLSLDWAYRNDTSPLSPLSDGPPSMKTPHAADDSPTQQNKTPRRVSDTDAGSSSRTASLDVDASFRETALAAAAAVVATGATTTAEASGDDAAGQPSHADAESGDDDDDEEEVSDEEASLARMVRAASVPKRLGSSTSLKSLGGNSASPSPNVRRRGQPAVAGAALEGPIIEDGWDAAGASRRRGKDRGAAEGAAVERASSDGAPAGSTAATTSEEAASSAAAANNEGAPEASVSSASGAAGGGGASGHLSSDDGDFFEDYAAAKGARARAYIVYAPARACEPAPCSPYRVLLLPDYVHICPRVVPSPPQTPRGARWASTRAAYGRPLRGNTRSTRGRRSAGHADAPCEGAVMSLPRTRVGGGGARRVGGLVVAARARLYILRAGRARSRQ